MIAAELGQLSLILALCLAFILAVTPILGRLLSNQIWQSLAKPLSLGHFFFLSLAFLLLIYVFVNDEFTVSYVAKNSNSLLPLQYKIAAVWGGHEGSLLLWVFILGGWICAISLKSKALPLNLLSLVLSVMGALSVGFLLFMITTSNPFNQLLLYPPTDGQDLNPLLQDFALIIHPPILYMGYVGFSVVFSFAVATLIEGSFDTAWARWSRPWTITAWSFLTIGIALGSWWAYYELGWGGWWFWDPVENASLMPWLSGTALIHSLAVSEKRGLFKSWTILLALLTFSLSLLGTFLVRSGVLTSVHAFATDPERGIFILIFLSCVVGCSFTLYALRGSVVKSQVTFRLISLETFLLLNNLLLVTSCAMVLLGTLYPIIIDALGLGKLSVGPPYFNTLFVPLALLTALAQGFGVQSRWKGTSFVWLLNKCRIVLLASIGLGVFFAYIYEYKIIMITVISLVLSCWIVLTAVQDIILRCHNKTSFFQGIKSVSRSIWAMHIAHIGFAVCIVGVSLVTQYSQEKDIRIKPGQSVNLGEYTFRFHSVANKKGPNYTSDMANIEVFEGSKYVSHLYPEKRFYPVQGSVMSDVAIDPGISRDLYVALGDKSSTGAWSLKIHKKPFVRCIWIGALLMAFGGLLAISDKRYHFKPSRLASNNRQTYSIARLSQG